MFMTQTPGAGEMLLGGWQVNGITTLQSGSRSTPSVANPRTNAGPIGSIRPGRIGSGTLCGGNRSTQNWFDQATFAAQGSNRSDPDHFGSSDRTILQGPALIDLDFSLFNKFAVRERTAVEVRSEFFSPFNTPRVHLPNRSLDMPRGGVITSSQLARRAQMALRLTFQQSKGSTLRFRPVPLPAIDRGPGSEPERQASRDGPSEPSGSRMARGSPASRDTAASA